MSSVSKAIEYADEKAQYDMYAKRVLSNREVLARILQATTIEFSNYSLDEIMDCIEGDLVPSTVSVHQGERIHGSQNEDAVPGEGKVTYDLVFYVVTPDSERVKLIINVEAQKRYDTPYDLVTRGVYYCGRLISAQKTREFENSEYDDIKKVYSIWICMNSPKKYADTITEYHLLPSDIYGHCSDTPRFDLMSVIMIRLDKDTARTQEGGFLGFLATLFSNKISTSEKKRILEEIYHFKVTKKIYEEVNTMCNLSDLVEERAIKRVSNKNLVESVEAIMNNRKVDLETACQWLNTTVEKYLTAKEELKEDY